MDVEVSGPAVLQCPDSHRNGGASKQIGSRRDSAKSVDPNRRGRVHNEQKEDGELEDDKECSHGVVRR